MIFEKKIEGLYITRSIENRAADLSKEVDDVAPKYQKHVYDLIVSKLSAKMGEIASGVAAVQEEKEEPQETEEEEKEDGNVEESLEALDGKTPTEETQPELPIEEKTDEVPYPSAAQFQRYQLNLNAAKNPEALKKAYEPLKPVPLTDQQKKSLKIAVKRKLQEYKVAQKLSVTTVSDDEVMSVIGWFHIIYPVL